MRPADYVLRPCDCPVRAWLDEQAAPATVGEVARAFGLSVDVAYSRLWRLREKGAALCLGPTDEKREKPGRKVHLWVSV